MFISTLTLPTSIQHAIKEENDTEEAVECRQSNFRHEAQYPVSKLSVTSLHLYCCLTGHPVVAIVIPCRIFW